MHRNFRFLHRDLHAFRFSRFFRKRHRVLHLDCVPLHRFRHEPCAFMDRLRSSIGSSPTVRTNGSGALSPPTSATTAGTISGASPSPICRRLGSSDWSTWKVSTSNNFNRTIASNHLAAADAALPVDSSCSEGSAVPAADKRERSNSRTTDVLEIIMVVLQVCLAAALSSTTPAVPATVGSNTKPSGKRSPQITKKMRAGAFSKLVEDGVQRHKVPTRSHSGFVSLRT